MLLAERNPLIPHSAVKQIVAGLTLLTLSAFTFSQVGWALRRFSTALLRPLTKFLTEILVPFDDAVGHPPCIPDSNGCITCSH
jgi:hypothetical protein